MFKYVYLSGPISGQDYEERFKAFEEKEEMFLPALAQGEVLHFLTVPKFWPLLKEGTMLFLRISRDLQCLFWLIDLFWLPAME